MRALHEALPDVHLKCYTASEIHHMTTLSGLTHEEVLRELQGGRARLAAGWRGRDLRRPGAAARRARQGAPGHLVPRARHRAPDGHAARTARCSTATSRPTRSAIDHLLRLRDQQDRDRRLPRVHPARLPPREHRLRAARLPSHDRRRRPQDARLLAADARQHPEHQGVLDHDGHAAGGRRRSTSAPTTCRAP